jgi:hypothetical protein
MQTIHLFAATALLALCGAAFSSSCAEKAGKNEIKVPEGTTPAVKKALKKLFPDGKMERFYKTPRGRALRWEAYVSDSKGLHYVCMRSNGSVVLRGIFIPPSTLPKAVSASLKGTFRDGKTTGVLKIKHNKRFVYHCDLVVGKERKKIILNEDGSKYDKYAIVKK